MRTTTTKSELEATVAELETQLEAAGATAEVLDLPNEARATILAEIDTMITKL